MANTIIQLKRSSANAVPQNGALAAAEPAYSYLSDKLFIGTSDGTGVIAIGGKYFVDQQNTIYNLVNTSYNAANSSVAGANAWTNTVFGYSNTYAQTVGAASNGWANTVAAGANAWSNTKVSSVTGTAGQIYSSGGTTPTLNLISTGVAATTYGGNVGLNALIPVITVDSYGRITSAANLSVQGMDYAYANAVGVGANNYANNTFLKLTGGVINGDLNVSGNLIIAGNTSFVNVSTFLVNDPLIYLAGNNYTSDVVDIGFVANYNNGACSTVHTGLFRDAANPNKEWYLFQEYNKEPTNNIIDPNGNNFTISVLNATLRTSNIILNGANLWSWVNGAYGTANAATNAAANANAYVVVVGAASNAWTNTSVTGANAWTNTSVAGANAWTNAVFGYANTRMESMVAANNVSGNAWTNTVFGYSNSYTQTVGAAANTNAANASYINTGTLAVNYGGTGVGTFTTNGVLYGNGTGALQVTSAGSDGQVLVSQGGVPQFRMLDGGVF
jgi:hypothetical protein